MSQKFSKVEFAELIATILDSIEKEQLSLGDDAIVNSQVEKLRKQLPAIQLSLKQKRGSFLTENLTAAQKARRADLQALFNAIKAAKASRSAEKQEAYKLLDALFTQYKEARNTGLEKTNGLVKSLLAKLALEENREAAVLLGLGEYITNLRESHQKTYQLYLNRQKEELTNSSTNPVALRNEMKNSFRLLCSHLANLVEYDSSTHYKKLYAIILKVNADFEESLKRSKAMSKKKNQKEPLI